MRRLSQFLFVFISVFWKATSFAATHYAASPAYADVLAAVDAAATGDIVRIPAGEAVWTEGLLTIKAIALLGAGQDQTIIHNHLTNDKESLIQFKDTHTDFVRVSGLTIVAGSNTYSEINIGHVQKTNVARVDHVTITNLIKRGITINGWSAALVDHCTIISHPAMGFPTGVSLFGLGHGQSAYGGNPNATPSWDTIPFALGTTNAVVVEDCTFDWHPARAGANGAVDAYNGARFQWRHNYMINVNVGAHGTDSSGSMRSVHSYECYGNVYSNAIHTIPFAFRGGTGIFYSNAVYQASGTPQNFIRIRNYRASGTNIFGGVIPCCDPYGPHSATNIYAGKEDPETGYPAFDQMGRTSPTIYLPDRTIQPLQPLYQWSNTFNGELGLRFQNFPIYTNVGEYAYIPPSSVLIQEDRDYYNDTAMPDYTPLVYPHPLARSGSSQSGVEPPGRLIIFSEN